jgi:5-methylcytosine-specific restriction enzyme subunit McrC
MTPTFPPRTLVLTERTTRTCRLPPADVEFLLAQHSAHVELVPTARRHHYRLTPRGHVGTIVGPSRRLVIRPKIPLANFRHLLDPDALLPSGEDSVAALSGMELLDFLAGRLARLLVGRATAGLHRDYVERDEHTPFLQGRLDLPAQLRDPAGPKDRFHCRFDDFTVDVPCNQFPRSTAELVLRWPLLAGPVRAALQQAVEGFAGVRSIPLAPDQFPAAPPGPLTQDYRPLLDLCRLLAEGLTVGGGCGPARFPAFLLDMERVFERYLTTAVEAAFPAGGRYEAAVQVLHLANRPVPGQPDIRLRPDVTINRDGRPVVVVDAKWKRLPGSPLVTEDLYQVLAYATALGAAKAVLVYPGRRDLSLEYQLTRAPLTVTIHRLRVIGSRPACARSLSRLVRVLKKVAGKL